MPLPKIPMCISLKILFVKKQIILESIPIESQILHLFDQEMSLGGMLPRQKSYQKN
jgi:hypothetical protein